MKAERFSGQYWLKLGAFLMIVVIAGVVVLFIAFFYLQLRAFITPHRNTDIGNPAEFNRPYENVLLTTRDGLTISGWYVPGTRSEAVVLVHGIHFNRQAVIPEAKVLADAGFHVMLIDLRGHGHSQNAQLSYGYYEALDVQAAVDYLAAKPEIEQIGALGISYGGSAVVRAAAQDPRIRAIIIESSFSSLSEAIDDSFERMSVFPKWPLSPLFVALAEWQIGVKADEVNSARDLATFSPRPVMIIHGTKDQLFPPHHAQRLYDTAQEPKTLWLIEGMTHDNPANFAGAEFTRRVIAFFNAAFAP